MARAAKKPPSNQLELSTAKHMLVKEVRAFYVTAPDPQGDPIRDPAFVAELLREAFELNTDPQENMVAAYLDSKNRLLGDVARIYRGTLNHCVVAPRDILYLGLERNAAAVVIAHNHPSGDPEPSPNDIEFTEHIVLAGQLLGLHVLDHLIIGAPGKFVSLRARGVIK